MVTEEGNVVLATEGKYSIYIQLIMQYDIQFY